MRKKKINESLSCFLVQPFMIVVLFAISFAASYASFKSVSIFAFLSALICLLSNRWSSIVLDRVNVSADERIHTCYPGDVVTVKYKIKNDKWVPMLWAHFINDEPRNNAIEFDANMKERTRKLSRIMWFGEVGFECSYKALRRGIYTINGATIRSGDGFGLTQKEMRCPVNSPSVILIYPVLRGVTTDRFHKNLWAGASGSKGYVEDTSVLKSTRDYVETDSWKRIDWRSFARGVDLQTRLYENVRPDGVMFALDARSFHYIIEETEMVTELSLEGQQSGEMLYHEKIVQKDVVHEEIENAISVIASLILQLAEEEIKCGLMLPASEDADAVTVLPDAEVDAQQLIGLLAQFDEATATEHFDLGGDIGGMSSAVQTYVFAYNPDMSNMNASLERLSGSQMCIVACDEGHTYSEIDDESGRVISQAAVEEFYDSSIVY